ncbi:MAG: hypothetical protein RIS11_1600, partial [Pseudomonadota bacterium]
VLQAGKLHQFDTVDEAYTYYTEIMA